MEFLTVTFIKPFRGFLEVHGHKKPELLAQLENEINAYQPHLKKIAIQAELHPILDFDTIYLALSTGKNKYHRCLVREKRSNNKAVIELIDYGSDYEVDASLLLELDPKNKTAEFLLSFPPIASKYILANFFCTWKLNERDIIDSLLCKSKLPITNEQMDREQQYISLDYNGIDVATKLITSHVGMEISFTEQRMEMRKLTQRSDLFSNGSAGSPAKREKRRNLVPTRPLQSPNNNNGNIITNQGKQLIQNYIAPKGMRCDYNSDQNFSDGNTQTQHRMSNRTPTFIANELPIGQFQVVYCSYIENGPNEFYIQLKSQEHTLDHLAVDLANSPRVQLMSKRPINMSCIGMACIARYSEDKNLYRAVIHKVHTNGCRVIFVDYGNSELVPLNELYEIPLNFLDMKTFAMPFELHGCENLYPIDNRLKKTFGDLIKEETLDLRVIPSKSSTAQQCELFLQDGRSVLEVLTERKNEQNTYSNAPHLKDGEYVFIRSVITAKKFYVQRVEDTPAFDRMMDSLLAHCHNAPEMSALPSKDKCYAAMHMNDNQEWYRVIVTDRMDNRHVLVLLVDYGIEIKCNLSQLREIKPEFLELPRQAIECCLADFVDVIDVPDTTRAQMELLVDDSNKIPISYKVALRHTLSNSYVVDLINEKKDFHVSLSIYKMAMPRTYSKTSNVKATTDADKSPKAVQTNRNNWQNVRECDGAESQEKFQEPMERSKERYDRNKDEAAKYDRAKQSKPRTDNTKPNTNSPPKNYQNRQEFDNRRNGDTNKKPILQKHIIPRFNKRHNRSRNNHNGKRTIGLDKNENWELSSGVADSSGSTEISSNNNNNNNKPSHPVSITTEEFVGLNPKLPDSIPVPLNSSTKVNLVDWFSPLEFHVQLKSIDAKCDEMMYQIQKYYRKRPTIQKKVPIGSLVIVRHKAENVLKRARIIDYNEARDKYRVQFIDYGSKALCQLGDIFEMEKSFTRLSELAIHCTFGDFLLNKPIPEIQQKVHNIINNAGDIECTFVGKDHDKNTVDMIVNGKNLKAILIEEKFLTSLPKESQLQKPSSEPSQEKPQELVQNQKEISSDVSQPVEIDAVKSNDNLTKESIPIEDDHTSPTLDKELVLLTSDVSQPVETDAEKSDDKLTKESIPIEDDHTPTPSDKELVVSTSEVSQPDEADAVKIDDNLTKESMPNENDHTPPTLDRELVFLTHVDHPNRFYIQLNSDTDAIMAFQESLQIVAPQLPALTDFRAGQLCIGKFTMDDNWYRGKIVDTDGEITSIQFIDYGNTDSITDNSLLKSIDSTMSNKDPFAVACSLPIEPNGTSEWSEAACNKLQMLCTDTPMEYEIISKDQNVVYVKLYFVGGRDLVKELIQEDVARPLEIIKSGETCFISHINSLDDFFIQVDSDLDALKMFESYLNNDNNSTVLDTVTVGTICSAKYDDGLFYRARILSILPDSKGYNVEFLDYGNTFEATEVVSMNPKIIDLPHLRKRCSLKLPDDVQNWSEQAEEKFHVISGEGATEFKVNLIKPGKRACIELFVDGHSVANILSELCEKRPDKN